MCCDTVNVCECSALSSRANTTGLRANIQTLAGSTSSLSSFLLPSCKAESHSEFGGITTPYKNEFTQMFKKVSTTITSYQKHALYWSLRKKNLTLSYSMRSIIRVKY